MSISLKCALIEPNQRSQVIFSIAHYRSSALRVLFGTPQQKTFFDDAIINTHYKNITFTVFEEYLAEQDNKQEIVLIADVPINFQTLSAIVKKAQQASNEVILILLKLNKKFLNMIQKKLSIKGQIMEFSHNKFVGINDKFREFVEKSYDLNREGFYAYGSYINYFRANLLKKIFRTDQINVAKLAKSFGFTTPPRVKEGNFLTEKARKERKAEKLKQKKVKEVKDAQVANQKVEAKVVKSGKVVKEAKQADAKVKPKEKKIKKIAKQ